MASRKNFKPLFGLQAGFWNKLDGVSTILYTVTMSKTAANMLGEHGLFGYGKSSKLEKFGKNKTWDGISTVSMVLFAFTLLHGAVDTYEEYHKIPDDQQLLPGRGIIYSAYDEFNGLGGVF